MDKSLVREAAEAFSNRDFATALDLYEQIANLIGRRYFKANIQLCQRRIWQSNRRSDILNVPLKCLKVACVMDEFTFHCYEPECDLMPLTPDNVQVELEKFKPDLLFIESAWRGKEELWNRKIGALSKELRIALQWCKERQVPTVFWNKEDPIHFQTFLTTAQQFDYVFTTDIDCIARYKVALGHERVFLLPFACQPKTHNPVEFYARKDAFCFAGAYYVRYPERTRDLENYVAEFPKYKPLVIYDRNFGKEDANYQFPPEYKPYIVGTLPFSEIDKAYKGYRYSINLNSIKQSQTMFARRVYELLGSNTVTVSNFSRGVRLLFGDLVVASDSGQEIIGRLQSMGEEGRQKLLLAGLRKVMFEHCYEHRLGYVAQKALGWRGEQDLPNIACIALVSSMADLTWTVDNFNRQDYLDKRLLVFVEQAADVDALSLEEGFGISVFSASEVAHLPISHFINQNEWVALFSQDDYYGPNYFVDLALATRYSSHPVIGKAACYQWIDEVLQLSDPRLAYLPDVRLPSRASVIRADLLDLNQAMLLWLQQIGPTSVQVGLSIDAFNYCENGRNAEDISSVIDKVDDIELDSGLPIEELFEAAETIPPDEFNDSGMPKWSFDTLAQMLGGIDDQLVHFETKVDGISIQSELPDGKHAYFYTKEDTPVSVLPGEKDLDTYLDSTPGLDVQYVFVFLDQKKQKISHVIHTSNRNHSASIPVKAQFIRFGLRVSGKGSAVIRELVLGHRKLEPATILGYSDTLLLTNHYPTYEDLYRNGFVHSRVKAYQERGVKVDVFRLQINKTTSYHEFQNIDVVTGGAEALHMMLDSGRYRSVLVHFLSPSMWDVLKHYPELHKIVWIHGAEIQPWHRRDYNYQTDQARALAIRESEQRVAFWRSLLSPMATNLKLVFVSRYFAEEVMEDLGFRLPDESYTIIYNPIDTELFSYEPKPAEQRRKVLSIRPYASRKYANDLSVQAILKLSEKPFFQELEFRMIGDGVLFSETLEPLRKFPNVTIEQRFLTHPEIAALHKEYGIFLVPTRMDAQGVSRDEAMASGLVPVTNAVAAIPEFVDENCGILAPAESFITMADGIERLVSEPDLFRGLSAAAAARVRSQTDVDHVVGAELRLMKK